MAFVAVDGNHRSESEFSVNVLGPFGIRHGCETMNIRDGLNKLIAFVALNEPKRSTIIGSFWPDVPETKACARLRTALWQIKRGCDGLIHVKSGRLVIGERVSVDCRLIRSRALETFANPHSVPLQDLVFGHRELGELLTGWNDEWITLEREYWRQLELHWLEAAASELFARGHIALALQAATSAVLLEPFRESANLLTIQIHSGEGNYLEAAKCGERYVGLIRDHFSAKPSPAFFAGLKLALGEGTPRAI